MGHVRGVERKCRAVGWMGRMSGWVALFPPFSHPTHQNHEDSSEHHNFSKHRNVQAGLAQWMFLGSCWLGSISAGHGWARLGQVHLGSPRRASTQVTGSAWPGLCHPCSSLGSTRVSPSLMYICTHIYIHKYAPLSVCGCIHFRGSDVAKKTDGALANNGVRHNPGGDSK